MDELLTYIRFANIVPTQSEAFPSESKQEQASMKEMISNYSDQINGEVYAELLADGVFKKDENEENQKAINQFKEKIRENGVSDAQIEALLDSGYNIVDILNASEESQSGGQDINSILENKRNELISSKGGTAR